MEQNTDFDVNVTNTEDDTHVSSQYLFPRHIFHRKKQFTKQTNFLKSTMYVLSTYLRTNTNAAKNLLVLFKTTFIPFHNNPDRIYSA